MKKLSLINFKEDTLKQITLKSFNFSLNLFKNANQVNIQM